MKFKLDHVALNCRSISSSVDWYVDNFDAQVIHFDGTWAMLDIGGQKLALTTPNEHKAHIAFRVESFDDFPEGIEIKTHRDGSMYYYAEDPNGNVIEYIYWPKQTQLNE
jgi:catechol 2,3-dioxygenase-like lactoylglutathione lyase family enzyme